MFCPKCKAEFREGFTECKKCNVDLVEELPVEEIIETDVSNDKVNYLAFLNWKVEKWLKIGGITLIIISCIVETLEIIMKFIPNIDVMRPLNVDGQLLFYYVLQLLYTLIKNIMYGIFYIALGKLLEIMRGKENEAA